MAHQERKKEKTILSFFTKSHTSKRDAPSPSVLPQVPIEEIAPSPSFSPQVPVEEIVSPTSASPPSKFQRVESDSIPVELSIERDPGIRIPIWQHPINKQDEIRRAYIKMGPYQPHLPRYPLSEFGRQNRSFQYNWFKKFLWLEYSPSKNAAFCFPCFIFDVNPTQHRTFIVDGFTNWRRVNDGDNCSFLKHVGGLNSPHNICVNSVLALQNVPQHIDKVINKQSKEEIRKNRLRLGSTVEGIKWLTLHGCALKGNDESMHSINQGNLREIIKFMGRLRLDVGAVVLQNAPRNAKFTSPKIQKEVLHIIANKVRKKICDEIGGAKFCCLVDESKDSSNKEQMAIVLRFVDAYGVVQERFFDIIHVKDTTASNLKKEICGALLRSKLDVNDLRGQGYDGASNMRGAWNGLQALFLRDSPSAYYVHCFAHRLQLALLAAAEKESSVWLFFSKLTNIVNIINASPKRHNELQSNQANEITDSIAAGERETGRGANQMGTLHRAGTTRWSSHFDSICGMIDMYKSVSMTLGRIIDESQSPSVCGEATGALISMRLFEFIFILHTMHKIMAITDLLSKALQQKNVDILSAMDLVSSTKDLLGWLRGDSYDSLMKSVKKVCIENAIPIPDMNARYVDATGRSCQQRGNITIEHHYRFDIYNSAIDFQLQELHSRFSDEAVELLKLSSSLDPKDNFKSFNTENICTLAEKFYPNDFTSQDVHLLKSQLAHYGYGVIQDPRFQGLSTLSELCQTLVKTNKSQIYFLIEKLIRLILTLPVSTATTERAFSAMKYVKSVLCNKMGEDFLADSMTVYIEREFSQSVDVDSVIDEFYFLKNRRVQLK